MTFVLNIKTVAALTLFGLAVVPTAYSKSMNFPITEHGSFIDSNMPVSAGNGQGLVVGPMMLARHGDGQGVVV
ncbi:MAG: hypothetical protein P1V13_22390 [Rhizobiaceae bacterium]|nr:hypothetical protein [Rhizobiaceae bacterium]